MQKSIAGSGAVDTGYRLLGADEPAPFIEEHIDGRSNFVIVVDHAEAPGEN